MEKHVIAWLWYQCTVPLTCSTNLFTTDCYYLVMSIQLLVTFRSLENWWLYCWSKQWRCWSHDTGGSTGPAGKPFNAHLKLKFRQLLLQKGSSGNILIKVRPTTQEPVQQSEVILLPSLYQCTLWMLCCSAVCPG